MPLVENRNHVLKKPPKDWDPTFENRISQIAIVQTRLDKRDGAHERRLKNIAKHGKQIIQMLFKPSDWEIDYGGNMSSYTFDGWPFDRFSIDELVDVMSSNVSGKNKYRRKK